jgi:hypothetical protein
VFATEVSSTFDLNNWNKKRQPIAAVHMSKENIRLGKIITNRTKASQDGNEQKDRQRDSALSVNGEKSPKLH